MLPDTTLRYIPRAMVSDYKALGWRVVVSGAPLRWAVLMLWPYASDPRVPHGA